MPATSPASAGAWPGRWRRPCWLNRPGCPPGARFKLDKHGLPVRTAGNVYNSPFACIVPNTSATTPARPLLFGHGLFQDYTAVDTINLLAPVSNAVICGTNFSGMSQEDLVNDGKVSADLSRFPTIADRLQQGILDFTFLGRAMIHPQGFSSNPEFAGRIDTKRLFYAGASLGGIIGGALTSVAPDFDRSALIVPGLRFSLLLTRSTQFPTFGHVLYSKYTDPVDQALVNSMIQLLWDRGEANGYVYHMVRDPLPNTPVKTVLLHEAFGDHQVSNVATETEARIIGAQAAHAGARPGAQPRPRAVLRHQAHPELSVEGQRPHDLRRGAAATAGVHRRSLPGHAARAGDQHAAGHRGGPAPAHRARAAGRVRVLGLPQGQRGVRGPLPEGQALLRPGVDGPVRRLVALAAAVVVAARRGRTRRRQRLRPDRPVALPLPLAQRLLPRARPSRSDGVHDADERVGHPDRAV